MTPKAYIFDVFGTLVDWRSSITRALQDALDAKGINADGAALAIAWRDEYDPSMAPIREGRRGYTNLDILHHENLVRVLKRAGLSSAFSEQEQTTLARAWEKLDPWPDTAAGLEAFRGLGLTAPCSNGSIALMSHLARYANFHWDCILGAEIARTYKPHPETYLAACRALQLRPDQVMMIAAHNADLGAAQAAGLGTGFVPRPHEHAEPSRAERFPTGDWTATGQTLFGLAQEIQSMHARA